MTAGVAVGLAAAAAGTAEAAPLPAPAAAEIDAITTGAPRYANSTWGIVVDDAVTGERLFAQERTADVRAGFDHQGGVPATIAPALRGGYGRRLPLDLEVIDFG